LPSELQNRLQPYLHSDKRRTVMDAEPRPRNGAAPHWPGGDLANFGDRIDTLHSIVIHGTGGWPSLDSANNMVDRFTCRVARDQGIGPSFCVDCNGTAFQLLDIDPPRVTLHGGYMNGVSFGIENTDVGDNTAVNPQPANQVYWRKLTSQPDGSDDLAGLELRAVLHPNWADGPDFIPVWFPTRRYAGPGDLDRASGFFTLFTEADYRTLVLLTRMATESFGIPRNFPLLPYADRPSNTDHVETLRRLVLADERGDMMIRMFGRTRQEFESNAATLETWYQGRRSSVTRFKSDGTPYQATINGAWTDFFADPNRTREAGAKLCYRGFVSHAMSGSISVNGDHFCPGPYFDWHRFAREVWDWWWYPFDFGHLFGAPIPTLTLAPRPHRQARPDTPLLDYYFDAEGQEADYESTRTPAAAASSPDSDEFSTREAVPIYALANGVLVAARIPNETIEPGKMGFVLCRHEVFHRTQVVDHGPVAIDVASIDYDRPPTFVYSLITHVKNPSVNFDGLSTDNPEWMNRLIKHLFQCKKANEFRVSHPADTLLRTAWRHDPIPSNRSRWSVGPQIERDALEYELLLSQLSLTHVTFFPIEDSLGATVARVTLGDYLGVAGRPGTPGVGITIFSREELPVLGRTHAVASLAGQDWWQPAVAATRFESDAAKHLPGDGLVWRYPMLSYLRWINGATWASEWIKYRVKDATGAPVARPARPRSRRGL
jgi:hypothetical protein